jgi:glycosyltransferase involved in cell wall biosynthesis
MPTMTATDEGIATRRPESAGHGDLHADAPVAGLRIAVVIPCHDEAGSIGRVVERFRALLPGADVVVVDNGSSDDTAACARAAGARVAFESRLGKGFALLTGFAETRCAEFTVMVDGDDTYPAADVTRLIEAAQRERADMVIGTRLDGAGPSAFRPGHGLGNRLFIALVRLLFGIRTRDLFSGYRVLSRRFLETVPLVATGFDVEAELSVQARVHGFVVAELPVEYRARSAGSTSKLHTLRDGYRILRGIMILFRDYRPMAFFGTLAFALLAAALYSGYAPIDDFLRTGLVHHLPRAVLAAALFILAALSIALGILLSSINRRSIELAALIRKRPS